LKKSAIEIQRLEYRRRWIAIVFVCSRDFLFYDGANTPK